MPFSSRQTSCGISAVELAAGVLSPGVSDVAGHIARAGLPSVRGKSVLDIGTCNGGVLFELERMGAVRLVGVDIYDQEFFGFAALRSFFASEAEFVQASVYGLDSCSASASTSSCSSAFSTTSAIRCWPSTRCEP